MICFHQCFLHSENSNSTPLIKFDACQHMLVRKRHLELQQQIMQITASIIFIFVVVNCTVSHTTACQFFKRQVCTNVINTTILYFGLNSKLLSIKCFDFVPFIYLFSPFSNRKKLILFVYFLKLYLTIDTIYVFFQEYFLIIIR